jgi:hypothetical protein
MREEVVKSKAARGGYPHGSGMNLNAHMDEQMQMLANQTWHPKLSQRTQMHEIPFGLRNRELTLVLVWANVALHVNKNNNPACGLTHEVFYSITTRLYSALLTVTDALRYISCVFPSQIRTLVSTSNLRAKHTSVTDVTSSHSVGFHVMYSMTNKLSHILFPESI